MLNITKQSLEKIIYVSLFLLGAIYVFNSWSPSSYGFFLKKIEPENSGVVWGEPRGIRSDEWGVVTPLTQATINNNFERYNKNSFYGEDLRINYGLPIFDWGLVFKPTMWGYLFLSPAKAYSLQWYLTFCIFIIGYFKLFKEVGIRKDLSLILSLSLFFTGGTQFWWDEKGPVYAFFPWVTYFLISKGNLYLRLMFFYWVGSSWLITNFYPPLVISLAFIGALLFLSDIKNWNSIKSILLLIVASVGIVSTALFYLKDYLIKTSQTVYPGHRSFSGGGVGWGEWISQFFPFSTFNTRFETIYNGNICEVGVTGFAFVMTLLVHVDYKSIKINSINHDVLKKIKLLVTGTALCNLWMIFPVPNWLGTILLWNNVSPNRMVYAAGILLAMTSLLFFQGLNFIISTKRFIFYSAITVAVWYFMKYNPLADDQKNFGGWAHNYTDFYLIIALAISYILIVFFSCKPINSFLITTLFASFLALFNFNPIQSSNAIFSSHSKAKNILDVSVDKKTGVLAIEGYPGATLNGLGYKSVSHVTAVPALDIWREKFADMPEDEFNKIFNRYSHIRLAGVSKPYSPQPDVVVVPLSLFNVIDYFPNDNDTNFKVIQINNNQKLSGSVITGIQGRMKSFSVLIGTYNGKSDGYLDLNICKASMCSVETIPLKNVMDNQYAEVQLTNYISVKKGDVINFTYTLRDAKHPVAIYVVYDKYNLKLSYDNNVILNDLSAKIKMGYESGN